MEIRSREIESIMVLSLVGELDSRSAPEVQQRILAGLPRNECVLLDFSGVTFVSSAGLRTMLLIYRQAQSLNSTVGLVGLTDEIRSVLSATGFLGFFIVSDSLALGLAALRHVEQEASGVV